jgi:AcrR family transcriptional regulator
MSTRSTRKAPRRTAERILEVALELFNRFGEPNVSTTAIAAELGISPGNLYYHYPAKENLVNGLFGRFERALDELLPAAASVRHVEDAWLFFHMLFELIWQYRFLYRDLNDLLGKNRQLEVHFPFVLKNKQAAVMAVLAGLTRGHAPGPPEAWGPSPDAADNHPMATAVVVVLTYWLSYEYVRRPRHALEPEGADAAMLHGAQHVLALLMPYLEADQQRHLTRLMAGYGAG